MKYFALLGVLALAVACGSKNQAGFVAPSDGGSGNVAGSSGHAGRSGGSAGRAGSAGTGGEAGETGNGGAAGAADSGAPSVHITSPTPVSDPTSGTVLTADAVTVTCEVTASPTSGVAVLGSSVTIQMFGADGKQIGSDGSVMSGANANEYAARFILTGVVPSGKVSFTCSASDQSSTPQAGTETVETFYDGGPTITLSNPLDKSAHALGAILFQFSALPTPLAAVDDGAVVTGVTLSVNGVSISKSKIIEQTGMPGYYQSDLDLSDSTIFNPKPAGSVSVTIKATNKRGTIATQNNTFVVDSIGPTITIVSPPTTSVQFIGGTTTVTFTVTDETGGSGVDPKSVFATLNATPDSFYAEGPNWHSDDQKTFYFTFHTEEYTGQLGVAIAFGADDRAGNAAQGTSAFYYLDNVPPILDLQPPMLQERDKAGSVYNCSEPFDPLGDSPHDLATIQAVSSFRALLWDVGNAVDGPGISFFSDIDTAMGVRLYFQPDTTKPLLKNHADTDPATVSRVCDEIADLTLPFIPLTPVSPQGSAYFGSSAPPLSDCVPGSETTPPDFLCSGASSLRRIITHETATIASDLSVIYAFQPDSAALCTGGQFDLTTKITKDGWVCAAVEAQDKMGNKAVSAPMRFCLDAAGFSGTPGCATGTIAPPTCVAAPVGCVPPPHFTKTEITKPGG